MAKNLPPSFVVSPRSTAPSLVKTIARPGWTRCVGCNSYVVLLVWSPACNMMAFAAGDGASPTRPSRPGAQSAEKRA